MTRTHLRLRLISRLRATPDWAVATADDIPHHRDAARQQLKSPIAGLVLGRPHRGVRIANEHMQLPYGKLAVRVHRPEVGQSYRRLVVHFHGGAFLIGSPEQSDWFCSRLAVKLNAVVASVDYRLAPEDPLPAAIDDGKAVTAVLRGRLTRGGVTPRVAVVGESAGATIAALVSNQDPAVAAQVLVNPALDWTDGMLEYDSVKRHGHRSTLPAAFLLAGRRFAVPQPMDATTVSPARAGGIDSVPTLVLTAGLDASHGHGEAYVERRRRAGAPVAHTNYPHAPHGFLSMPGVVREAHSALDKSAEFLQGVFAL
jgi:acetyl esterase